MKQLTQAARAAAQIRSLLKKKYPSIKFSVTSKNYSMGDNVNVSYVDGVPEKEVESLIKHYQYGHFDGMDDMYHNSNSRSDIPQTKYLFVERNYSDKVKNETWEKIKSEGLGMTCRGWTKVDEITWECDKYHAITYELREKTL